MAVITLSRQLESGGDEVADLVCQKLGYQRFDKKAMAQVGQEMGLAGTTVDRATDDQPGPKSLVERWFGNYENPQADPVSWGLSSQQDALQDLSIANLVDIMNAGYRKGNIVIVGRGGMAALQNKPDVLHVRIQAPLALRIKRLREHEGLSELTAQDKMRARDLSDVDWIKRYFGLDSHDPALFDVIINTAKITPTAAADLVVQALAALPAKGK
jgi:cytidylate kinase